MKHLLIPAICLSLMLVLLQAACSETKTGRSGPEISTGTLTGVQYTDSGDEYGNVYSAGISLAEDGTLALTVMESETFQQPVTVSRYAAADDTLQRIAEIVNAYDMTGWADRPDELTVCDASHPWLILEVLTGDGQRQSFRISGYIGFSAGEQEAYDSVITIIHESITPANLLETCQVEQS